MHQNSDVVHKTTSILLLDYRMFSGIHFQFPLFALFPLSILSKYGYCKKEAKIFFTVSWEKLTQSEVFSLIFLKHFIKNWEANCATRMDTKWIKMILIIARATQMYILFRPTPYLYFVNVYWLYKISSAHQPTVTVGSQKPKGRRDEKSEQRKKKLKRKRRESITM